jgi:excisionase family DNA binding protein
MSAVESSLAVRPREAAKLLGVSVRTLQEYRRRGLIRAVKIGRGRRAVVLFEVDELKRFLAENREGEGTPQSG